MRLSKCIPVRRAAVPGRAAIPFGPILALLLAGCASQSEYREASWYDGTGRQVVLEDDGMPAQTPPVRRSRTESDDPSEPFSPNYGPPVPPPLPADLPPAFRRQLANNVG
ncbi:MAG: hypothetical protein KJZ80_00960 [Hyphomicrobiaceae bacterium]|nr:hypothetical protein [Hyphomicrobiaceae bacterium]